MRRREFITVLGGAAAAWPLVASAQKPTMPVVGILSPESSTTGDVEGLRAGLRDLGYVEGQNIRFEYRWAEGDFARLPALAADLVQLNVDVLVTYVTQASLVAKKATATIPIVMVGVGDPVGVSLIASLAHPGGNVTGTSSIASALAAKQLELLKEAVPEVRRVAALWNPANFAFQSIQLKQAEGAARTLGIELQLLEARSATDFDAAFAAIDGAETRALLILLDPLYIINFRKLVELSSRKRLITMTGYRTFVEAGGLMAYGPNYNKIYRLAAIYCDKILKGAKPSDLPVEQPNKFEFVINLKTARSLDLTIPPTLLALADEVIE
jgi:putative tryptophan/tyrosine transport system substrate-binding protein